MVFFVSHKILLFTHKPLDTYDKGYRAESYQNLINGLFENLEALDITRVSDFFNLFPLAPCKSILNTFVYEIYQRVFILFELSVKHTLSDFLLPFRCHTIMATIWLNQLVENKFKIILFSNNESLFVKPFFIIFTPINKVVYIFF